MYQVISGFFFVFGYEVIPNLKRWNKRKKEKLPGLKTIKCSIFILLLYIKGKKNLYFIFLNNYRLFLKWMVCGYCFSVYAKRFYRRAGVNQAQSLQNDIYYIDTDEITGFFQWQKFGIQWRYNLFYPSLVKISRLSVSASRKSASQHLTLSVYIINRILHAYTWIRILSSRVQLDISLVRCTHSWDIEFNTQRQNLYPHAGM